MVLLVGVAVVVARIGPPQLDRPFVHRTQVGPHVSSILAVTWVVAFCVYALVKPFAADRACAPRQLLAASLVLPGVGLALLLPLTLHLAVALAFGGHGDGFDRWVLLSRDLTAPAHVVFAALVARRGLCLARGQRAPSPLGIFAIVVVVASVPWAILVLPPLLVTVTGVPLVPALAGMETLVARELAALGGDLPAATARSS
jgi:hypothetical protein